MRLSMLVAALYLIAHSQGCIDLDVWQPVPQPGQSVTQNPKVILEWDRTGGAGEMDMIYEHEIGFKPDMNPQVFKRRLLEKAAQSTAPVLVFDIEDYDYVHRHIDVVREITIAAKRPGRTVCWYNWAASDRAAAYAEVDAIYVPVHRARGLERALPNGLKVAKEYDKPLILQWTFRELGDDARHLTLTEAANHLEMFRRASEQVPLMISMWASDHNAAARRVGRKTFRSEPRWGVWAYTEFAREIETALASKEPITRSRWINRVSRASSQAVETHPASTWERAQKADRSKQPPPERTETTILISDVEVSRLINEEPESLTYQQFLDACRMFLLRGYRVAVQYPEHRRGFPAYQRFLEDL
jgi:hypothetical protein